MMSTKIITCSIVSSRSTYFSLNRINLKSYLFDERSSICPLILLLYSFSSVKISLIFIYKEGSINYSDEVTTSITMISLLLIFSLQSRNRANAVLMKISLRLHYPFLESLSNDILPLIIHYFKRPGR